jgi:hypothetical protein
VCQKAEQAQETKMRYRVITIGVLLTVLGGGSTVRAQDSTSDLIRGARVDNLVRIQRASDATREQTKAEFQFSARDKHLESLQPNMTMTSKGEVRFAYIDFNPLAVTVVGSETSAPDPNFVQLSEFVDALLKVPGKIEGGQSGRFGDCKAMVGLNDDLKKLTAAMNASDGLAKSFNEWKAAIAKAPGPTSIKSQQQLMRDNAENLATNARNADAILKKFEELSSVTSDRPTTQPPNAKTTTSNAKKELPPQQPAATGAANTAKKDNNVKDSVANSDAVAPSDCSDAEAVARSLMLSARSNPAYQERISKLNQLAAALKDLADSLDRYTGNDWEGSSFVFFTSRPSAELKKTITIKATPLTFRFESATMTRAQIDAKAVSTSFFLRQYQAIVPELAAGLVVANVKAPQFGTGTDAAGKTIVVRQKDKDVSFAGALLLNWVAAEPSTASLQPLFQTGVSLSADGPGILAGFGVRIGRPKRVALAAGAILAWVKDLDKLTVGGPVSGTAELKDDLHYSPTVKAYFVLQYQFRDAK